MLNGQSDLPADPSPDGARFTLYFRDKRAVKTEFIRSATSKPIVAATYRDPLYARVHARKQFHATCAFFVWQAVWAARNPDVARALVARAVEEGLEVPDRSAIIEGGRGTFVPTFYEVARAKRPPLKAMFGDDVFIEDCFGRRREPPAVWLNCKIMPPTAVHIKLDDERVTDPARLTDLARQIEREAGLIPLDPPGPTDGRGTAA